MSRGTRSLLNLQFNAEPSYERNDRIATRFVWLYKCTSNKHRQESVESGHSTLSMLIEVSSALSADTLPQES